MKVGRVLGERVDRVVLHQARRLEEERRLRAGAVLQVEQLEELRVVRLVDAVEVVEPLRGDRRGAEHARRGQERQRQRQEVLLLGALAHLGREPVVLDERAVVVAADLRGVGEVGRRDHDRQLFGAVAQQEEVLVDDGQDLVLGGRIDVAGVLVELRQRRPGAGEALDVERDRLVAEAERELLDLVVADLEPVRARERVAEAGVDTARHLRVVIDAAVRVRERDVHVVREALRQPGPADRALRRSDRIGLRHGPAVGLARFDILERALQRRVGRSEEASADRVGLRSVGAGRQRREDGCGAHQRKDSRRHTTHHYVSRLAPGGRRFLRTPLPEPPERLRIEPVRRHRRTRFLLKVALIRSLVV